VKLLVTSRAPLHVRGERELQIQPLATPGLSNVTDVQSLSQYASVTLFIQRAQALRPGFSVTNENAPAIAEICYRLDGLPLAIELAAARIRMLSPQELLARLGNRLTVLRGGTRDLPERHQTLRAAIDWSYNLLSERARAVFRRLAVFSGGWSLEAAEAFCNCDDDPSLDVLDEMEALVDLSVLTRAEGVQGEPRFGMLGTIHEYALERLLESGEAERLRRLHAVHFHHFSREVEPRIRTAERARWRGVLEQDLDNIRAAIHWSMSSGEKDYIGIRIAVALSYFWTICGHITEARQLAQIVGSAADDVSMPMDLRAGIKWGQGGLLVLTSENSAALPLLLHAADLARQAGDEYVLAHSLLWGGGCALTLGDAPLAASLLEECLALHARRGDDWPVVLALRWMSNLATVRGETARAQELFGRSLELAERQGDPWCLLALLTDVAQNAFAQGDLAKAEATILKIVSILQVVTDKWILSWALSELGLVALARGGLDLARGYFAESLELAREYGNMIAMVLSLAGTAVLLSLRTDLLEEGQRAAQLRTAARLCGAIGTSFDHPLFFSGSGPREQCAALIAQVQASVDGAVWEPALAEGAATPLEHSLALAAEELRAGG
jgi:non-specific serine/threonine protein kinase